jgi:predicted phosphodiesterase
MALSPTAGAGSEVIMEIAVISDIHLGSGGSTDLFGHDDAEFLRFLSFLERNFEKIVLLGDIWETLTGKAFGDPVEELREARAHHREIAERFRRPQYSYVFGNHDLVAQASEGAPEQLTLSADGMRLVFSHGHQGDQLISKHRWLSEIGVWLGAWIRRVGLHATYACFSRLEALRGGAGQEPTRCKVRRWAPERAQSCEADVIVAGHTHVPTRAEHGSCIFLNSGSCAEGRLSYLTLDTRRADFAVHSAY